MFRYLQGDEISWEGAWKWKDCRDENDKNDPPTLAQMIEFCNSQPADFLSAFTTLDQKWKSNINPPPARGFRRQSLPGASPAVQVATIRSALNIPQTSPLNVFWTPSPPSADNEDAYIVDQQLWSNIMVFGAFGLSHKTAPFVSSERMAIWFRTDSQCPVVFYRREPRPAQVYNFELLIPDASPVDKFQYRCADGKTVLLEIDNNPFNTRRNAIKIEYTQRLRCPAVGPEQSAIRRKKRCESLKAFRAEASIFTNNPFSALDTRPVLDDDISLDKTLNRNVYLVDEESDTDEESSKKVFLSV